MNEALIISAIGIGLVFGAILLLWGLMVLLVRATTPREPRRPGLTSPEAAAQMPQDQDPALPAQYPKLRRAAIAAVVVALAHENEPLVHEFPLPPTAIVSAWQVARRASNLQKRGSVR